MSSSAKGKEPAVPAARATAAYREYDHPERQSLISELLDNLNLHNDLHAEIQGFLWLSDIQCLRGLALVSRGHKMRGKIEIEEGYNENDDYEDEDDESDINEGGREDEGEDNKGYSIPKPSLSLDFQVGYRGARVPETWCTRARLHKDPVSPSKKCRDNTEKKETSERDDGRCVVIKMGAPYEVAHIYPFCLNQQAGQSAMESFWQTLSVFWSEEKVDAWKRAVMGNKGTESPMNMLTLSPTVHRLWGACFFALKPIRASKHRLVVEFHWLQPRSKGKKHIMVNARIRPDCLAEIDSPGQDIRLIDCPSGKIIASGTRIAIKTDDPHKRPLPSFALLEMQWNLQRVAALSGMAEWRDQNYGDSDSDDYVTGIFPFLNVDSGSEGYDDDGDEDDDDEDDDDDHGPLSRSVSPLAQQESSEKSHRPQASSHPRPSSAFVSPILTASPPQTQSAHSPQQFATRQQHQHQMRQPVRDQKPHQSSRQLQPRSKSPQSQRQPPRAAQSTARSPIQARRRSLRHSPSLSPLSAPNSPRSLMRTSSVRRSVGSPSRASGGPSPTRQPSRFFAPQQIEENQPPSPSKASERRDSVSSMSDSRVGEQKKH